MADPEPSLGTSTSLRPAIALRVDEEGCDTYDGVRIAPARFAPGFPRPRLERVSPGHLLALATAPDQDQVAVWRWYDAVVLGDQVDGGVRVWEPAHGVVRARRRHLSSTLVPGSRAYLSAGLPGADWWLAGPVVDDPSTAEVELGEVTRLYDENHLWSSVFPPSSTS